MTDDETDDLKIDGLPGNATDLRRSLAWNAAENPEGNEIIKKAEPIG